jgi:hypothetical protein
MTVAFALPYERRAATRFLAELNRQPATVLTGLALAVDHRFSSRRAWVLATFDVSSTQGHRACGSVLKACPYPRSDVTVEAVFRMVERGECNLVSFAGTEADQALFDAIWPAGFHARAN